MMHMPDDNCYIISDDAGIYEVLVDLNSSAKTGDAVGQIHFVQKPELAPSARLSVWVMSTIPKVSLKVWSKLRIGKSK